SIATAWHARSNAGAASWKSSPSDAMQVWYFFAPSLHHATTTSVVRAPPLSTTATIVRRPGAASSFSTLPLARGAKLTRSAIACHGLGLHSPSQFAPTSRRVNMCALSLARRCANIVLLCAQSLGAAIVYFVLRLPRSITSSRFSNTSLSLSPAGTSALTAATSTTTGALSAPGAAPSFRSADFPHPTMAIIASSPAHTSHPRHRARTRGRRRAALPEMRARTSVMVIAPAALAAVDTERAQLLVQVRALDPERLRGSRDVPVELGQPDPDELR